MWTRDVKPCFDRLSKHVKLWPGQVCIGKVTWSWCVACCVLLKHRGVGFEGVGWSNMGLPIWGVSEWRPRRPPNQAKIVNHSFAMLNTWEELYIYIQKNKHSVLVGLEASLFNQNPFSKMTEETPRRNSNRISMLLRIGVICNYVNTHA